MESVAQTAAPISVDVGAASTMHRVGRSRPDLSTVNKVGDAPGAMYDRRQEAASQAGRLRVDGTRPRLTQQAARASGKRRERVRRRDPTVQIGRARASEGVTVQPRTLLGDGLYIDSKSAINAGPANSLANGVRPERVRAAPDQGLRTRLDMTTAGAVLEAERNVGGNEDARFGIAGGRGNTRALNVVVSAQCPKNLFLH